MQLIELAKQAKMASRQIMNATTNEKNHLLMTIAETLSAHIPAILEANEKDVAQAIAHGMPANLQDRLRLDEQRIAQIIEGIEQVCQLDDPLGEITHMHTSKNGLQIGQMRVALGVVGMIYEARPNVSVDATVLCLKAGNAVMLRGSKDIIESNKTIVATMREAVTRCGFDANIITLIEDTSRATATQFMKLNGYLDVLIPRGGASLIQSTIEQATVPVLETGTGNCHVYVDKDADLEKALQIIVNAKTTRTSVCNACESVLLHRSLSDAFVQDLVQALINKNVILHGDARVCELDHRCILANEEDYKKEYLALELSMKYVDDVKEAISHINRVSTHHSETIVSENYTTIKTFLKEIDSACVYANASTRFSDGFEFGFGAEIGISTQKLHARGPMGLLALTSQKYIILGDGQIR